MKQPDQYVRSVQRFDRAVAKATPDLRCPRCKGPMTLIPTDRVFTAFWKCEPCNHGMTIWDRASFLAEYGD